MNYLRQWIEKHRPPPATDRRLVAVLGWGGWFTGILDDGSLGMKNSVLFAVLFSLAGCEPSDPSDSPGYGAVRERLFVQCMKLAKDTVQAGHYNDSAEVISECSSQSYYMANSYKGDGYKGAKPATDTTAQGE